jgi:hypothetical protein
MKNFPFSVLPKKSEPNDTPVSSSQSINKICPPLKLRGGQTTLFGLKIPLTDSIPYTYVKVDGKIRYVCIDMSAYYDAPSITQP